MKKDNLFYIRIKKHNLKVIFVDRNNNFYKELSTKNLNFTKKNRTSIQTIGSLLQYFVPLLTDVVRSSNTRRSVILRIKGFGNYANYTVPLIRTVSYYLKKSRWEILSVEDYTPIVHNGCRLRKKRH